MVVTPREEAGPVLRTVHSILNRSPPELLAEIIIVDDTGNLGNTPWLTDPAILAHLAAIGKASIVRFKQSTVKASDPPSADGRIGIMMCRQLAVERAKGDAVTFVDSHAEVEPGWLEPMLSEVGRDSSKIAFPQLDWENPGEWDIHKGGIGCVLGFLWSPLSEHEIHEPDRDRDARNDVTKARSSPVLFGAVFTIDRSFFLRIGGFDPEYGYGGGENLELSFRTWMCGGSVVCAPCSRVFIVFYKKHTNGAKRGHWFNRNALRTAEIWMDEYAPVVKSRFGSNYPADGAGPLDKWKGLRSTLGCKSFRWYLSTVYPDNEITQAEDMAAFGSFKSKGKPGKCLDTMQRLDFGKAPGLYGCSGGGSQVFALLTKFSTIMPVQKMEVCLEAGPKWARCVPRATKKDIHWAFDPDTAQLREKDTRTCLTAIGQDELKSQPCDPADENQKWELQSYASFQAALAAARGGKA